MTKAEARRIFQVKSDYALAKAIGRNRASVSRWGRMVPKGLHMAIKQKEAGDIHWRDFLPSDGGPR